MRGKGNGFASHISEKSKVAHEILLAMRVGIRLEQVVEVAKIGPFGTNVAEGFELTPVFDSSRVGGSGVDGDFRIDF